MWKDCKMVFTRLSTILMISSTDDDVLNSNKEYRSKGDIEDEEIIPYFHISLENKETWRIGVKEGVEDIE